MSAHYTGRHRFNLKKDHACLLQIGTLQALLQSPNVLVCVGSEGFKPIMNEDVREPSEKLPGVPRRTRTESNNDSADTKKNG